MGGEKFGRIFMAAGLVCLAAALLLAGYNVWDDSRAAKTAGSALEQLRAAIPSPESSASPEPTPPQSNTAIQPDPTARPEPPTLTIDGESYIGVLSVPALGLELPVFSEWSYENLKQSPCRFRGAAGEDGFILVGHNYRRHFGKLENLSPGDEVRFTDVEGKLYLYEVAELEQLGGDDLEELTAADRALSLVTCTWDGRSRLVVRCVSASS